MGHLYHGYVSHNQRVYIYILISHLRLNFGTSTTRPMRKIDTAAPDTSNLARPELGTWKSDYLAGYLAGYLEE